MNRSGLLPLPQVSQSQGWRPAEPTGVFLLCVMGVQQRPSGSSLFFQAWKQECSKCGLQMKEVDE